MEQRESDQPSQQDRAMEAAYRRGYHHGFTRTREIVFGLLQNGLPASAVADLCRIFEEEVVLPWRAREAETSSAPPVFDLEECQRLLREYKQRQTERE